MSLRRVLAPRILRQRFLLAAAVLLGLGVTIVLAADEPAVSAEDLLDPSMFPEAQFGMQVVSAKDGPTAEVVTTGGVFRIDKKAGTVTCRQTIAQDREVAVIRFPEGTLSELKMQRQTDGMAYFVGGGATLRINGDSLLMVQPGKAGPIEASLRFKPDFHAAYHANHNFFDPFGGISFFEHGRVGQSQVSEADGGVRVAWQWPEGAVFWAGVSPPRPFDWEAAQKLRVVVVGGSDPRYMFPSDLQLYRFKQFDEATTVYVHAEEMWVKPQLDLTPRDPEGFTRMMASAEEYGLQTIVYASPHFYLAGTEQAKDGVHDPHHFVGNFSGANVDRYLAQAENIVKKYGADGLYFDEMYHHAPALAVNYYLTRKARALVGDGGPLFLHCTTDLFGNGHYGPICPTVGTYFNVIYKGEGPFHERNLAYTRYILGTHNTSNAIGVQLTDERFVPKPEDYEFWVNRGNLRFFIHEYWYHSGDIDVVQEHYWPLITDGLKERIEPTLLQRVEAFTLDGRPLPPTKTQP